MVESLPPSTMQSAHMSRFGNSSIDSNVGERRAVSLATATMNIVEERKRQIQDVKRGFQSTKIFRHTINDIVKVLDQKLGRKARDDYTEG